MVIFFEKILVVANEISTPQLLLTSLKSFGYKVFSTSNRKAALTHFNKEQPDLVIIDIVLPKLDGYFICQKIREHSNIPIIMLTALDNISDQLPELGSEVNDYIIKPFSPKELEFRVKSVLSRHKLQTKKLSKRKKIFQVNDVIIDIDKKLISKNNFIRKLTRTEVNLLALLVENEGSQLSRSIILDNLWGYTPERQMDERVVDVYISRLRLKIEENPNSPDLILTIRGIGYMFQSR